MSSLILSAINRLSYFSMTASTKNSNPIETDAYLTKLEIFFSHLLNLKNGS